ncbi:hypothetical protein [Virgibacillus salexigens]|uniref:RiboL-PSP-HEPN domain-containing protein n=1 Tax=Virgibacillus kapii TaxID=1638645 RepID=A0ABQ2DY43_9BACI|nr:hypothetical protein [Virgibacillus kapii]GGJ77960.1 hypothetical protein GCM10007111_44320 [Virgibacillus kapii]
MGKKYISNWHDLTISFFQSEIEAFIEYEEYIESNFKRKLDYFDKEYKKVSEELKEAFIDHYMDDIILYRDEFPSILRESLLMSIYSFFENKLTELCDQEKMKEFAGSYIKKASTYIKREMKIDFPDEGKEWIYINNINEIRNCLVHYGGETSRIDNKEELKKLHNAISKVDHVSIGRSPDKRIKLEEGVCKDLLTAIESIITQTYKNMTK